MLMCMAAGETVAKTSAAVATFAGPVLMTAEATGALHETTRPLMVYMLGGALSLVGFMFTALMWFIKREHTSITSGIEGLKKGTAELSALVVNRHSEVILQVSGLTLRVESGFAQMGGEVARRMLIEEHGRSSSRIHGKINQLGRRMAFLTGKLGLQPEDSGSEEDNEANEA